MIAEHGRIAGASVTGRVVVLMRSAMLLTIVLLSAALANALLLLALAKQLLLAIALAALLA